MKKQLATQKSKLLVALSLLVVAGFLTTSLVSFFVSRSSLRYQIHTSSLPLTSENIYSEIQRDLLRPVSITSFMANDTFLRDWILNGEKNVDQISHYLNEIKTKYNTVTSFFISESTRNYYYANGILKKVSPEEERDIWYFRVRKMKADYEINVDPDMANKDAMTIFINHKVYDYKGNYLGAAGVGLTISEVITLIDKYNKKYNRDIYFTDQAGNILLCGHIFPKTVKNIHQMEDLASIADTLLTTNSKILNYSRKHHTIHLSTLFIPELNWFLFVEQTEQRTIRNIYHALIINLLFCALITIVVIVLTTFSINIYQKMNERQQLEIVQQHDTLIDKNTELEKALLEKSNALNLNKLLMREMNHRVKNNLSVIQSLLRLQSAKTHDAKSKSILRESENRVRTITNMHQMLSTQNDLSKVNASRYIQNLVDDLVSSTDLQTSDIEIKTQFQKMNLDLDQLIPFSLILNELITNAFKYAFTEKKKGRLEIFLHPINKHKIELIVKDNGAGLPEGFNIKNTTSLGMQIIQLLTEQIEGKLTITSKSGQGTAFNLVFKKK